MTVKVFVGSSVEGLGVAYAVQQNLERTAEVTVWNQGIFQLSASALDFLNHALAHFDFGIFIFTPDDIVLMRGNENRTVRDNVLFELGLFVGRLGKDRSFLLVPRGQPDFRLPTDLIGMTPATYQPDRSDASLRAATGASCHEIYEAMVSLGPINNDKPQAPQSNEPITRSTLVEQQQTRAEDLDPKHKVLKTTEQMSDQEPDWVELLSSDEYEKAINALERIVEKSDAENEKIWFRSWIGYAKVKLNLKTGVQYLNNLIEQNPNNADPYTLLALVYKEAGLTDKALTALDAGLAAATEKEWLQLEKAELLFGEGDPGQALGILQNLIVNSPEFGTSYSRASQILVERGENDEAGRMYEAGLKVLPNDEDLLYRYGRFLIDIDDYEKAMPIFRRLTELNSKSSDYLVHLGNTYLRLSLNGLAMEAYDKANVLAQGKEAWILENIGNLFNNQGLYPLAIQHLKTAITLDPDSAYGHDRLSQAINQDSEERKKANDLIRKDKEARRKQTDNETEHET